MTEKSMGAWLGELERKGLKTLNFSMDVYETDVGHWTEINWHDVGDVNAKKSDWGNFEAESYWIGSRNSPLVFSGFD